MNMDKAKRDYTIRLILGLLINLAIVIPALSAIGTGYINFYAEDIGNSHFQIVFFGVVAAVISLLLTMRILWRGSSWQQFLSILLIPMPAILLFEICRFCVQYWIRGY